MLWGRFADWDALLRLPHLQALEIRFTPDLQGLPPLDSWPLLDRFIAYNVDEAAGKLRAQMKARGQQRAWTSQPRSASCASRNGGNVNTGGLFGLERPSGQGGERGL